MGQCETSLAEPNRALLIAAPQDYFLGPVFAATPQKGPREVTVGDKRYLVGGFCPLPVNFNPPALDIRHARAVFTLLSFRKRDEENGTRLIRFSFNEFCKRYANSNGGRYSREIARILGDLVYSFIRVTDVKTEKSHEYRIIEHVDIERHPIRRKDSQLAKSPQLEMWFNGCTLSPDFYGLLNRIAELQYLKLKVFTAIRSPLAQAIYLYIPSRAYHHAESKPFEITITNLLEQVSFPVPALKCRRKQLFTQNRNSIIRQLDGVETLTGRFRVRLVETTDGDDWKIQTWIEKASRAAPESGLSRKNSKLINAYLKSGGTQEQADQALRNVQPLSDYELELLQIAKISIEKNLRFFEMAKAILKPSQFKAVLHEAKGDELEGRPAKKNPTARLIYRIMEAVSAATPSALASFGGLGKKGVDQVRA